ncbi:hypothetical protein SESBI_49291 [Sesbania bispinosa]|nr:hypothetical protein SESBI_49291 [Sesbania bispinosa]
MGHGVLHVFFVIKAGYAFRDEMCDSIILVSMARDEMDGSMRVTIVYIRFCGSRRDR